MEGVCEEGRQRIRCHTVKGLKRSGCEILFVIFHEKGEIAFLLNRQELLSITDKQ
jgi:hypothetical protein